MAISDAKINAWTKELQVLERKIDTDPKNEDLRRERKNIRERIRLRNIKLTEQTESPEPAAPRPTKSFSIKKKVQEGMKDGLDAKAITRKYNLKEKSVRWYICKLNKLGTN